MAKYRIMNQSIVPAQDSVRAGKLDTIVAYLNVDKGVSGWCRIPKESPTIEEITAAIKAKEASPQNHTGKEITL